MASFQTVLALFGASSLLSLAGCWVMGMSSLICWLEVMDPWKPWIFLLALLSNVVLHWLLLSFLISLSVLLNLSICLSIYTHTHIHTHLHKVNKEASVENKSLLRGQNDTKLAALQKVWCLWLISCQRNVMYWTWWRLKMLRWLKSKMHLCLVLGLEPLPEFQFWKCKVFFLLFCSLGALQVLRKIWVLKKANKQTTTRNKNQSESI